AYLTLWFPLLIWWTPLCRMLQIMTRRFTLYAYTRPASGAFFLAVCKQKTRQKRVFELFEKII
ncbi:MAG: hypothetical protein E7C35_22355, partial [Enterobacter hormaechei]|nr:hypothetical protein [Enterobacter hormaechei]